MRQKKYEWLYELLWVIVGNFLLALGVAWFIIPNNILTAGLAGIAIALEPIFHITPELMINILTVVLFLVGTCFLGRKFATKTLLSTILYPLFLSFLSYIEANWLSPDMFVMDKYLASIYGGALMGAGTGLVFYTGASTGGVDIPPLIINKYTKIPLSKLIFLTDAFTVLLGAAVYGLEAVLIGIISVFISSYMINRMMLMGGQSAMNVMIISSKYEEIMSEIHKTLHRGTTILEGVGGYSQVKKPVLMVIIVKKQLHDLQMIVSHIDEDAFVIVSDTKEVQGKGFSYEDEL